MDIKDRVLIVEDDKSIRNFLRTVLEANNFDVITAVTGLRPTVWLRLSAGPGDSGSGSARYGRHENSERDQGMVCYADSCGLCQKS